MNLELMAMRWLRWEKRCPIVLTERTPREWAHGRPDILGITCSRYLVEVEIKRTLSDFRADGQKASRQRRHHFQKLVPKFFYYLVPSNLVDRVRPELPPWAGLMRGPVDGEAQSIYVVLKSPTNHDSQRLSLKECVRVAYLVSNEAISARESLESTQSNFRYGHVPYWGLDYEI